MQKYIGMKLTEFEKKKSRLNVSWIKYNGK